MEKEKKSKKINLLLSCTERENVLLGTDTGVKGVENRKRETLFYLYLFLFSILVILCLEE